jgi:hypothetical protein
MIIENVMSIIIIFIIFSSLIVLIYFISNNTFNKSKQEKKKKKPNNIAAELYNNIDIIKNKLTENQINSGVLVHMFSLEDMINLDNNDNFKFNLQTPGTSDCGGVTLKSCSAWSYLRKDLPPILFTYPVSNSINKENADDIWKSIVGLNKNGDINKEMIGSGSYWTPNCAVILDAKKAWPLLTTMGIIDSGTDERNCLSNGRGSESCDYNPGVPLDWYCGTESNPRDISKCSKNEIWPTNLTKIKRDINIGISRQSTNKGSGCITNCNEIYQQNDIRNNLCKYRVSGGSLSLLNLGSWRWNWDESDKNDRIQQTFNLNPKTYSDEEKKQNVNNSCNTKNATFYEWTPGSKSFARNPFLCKTEKTPAKAGNDIYVDTYHDDEAFDVIYNYVGTNTPDGLNVEQSDIGKTFSEQYYGKDFREPLSPINSSFIQNTQCKWEKKDWNRWTNEIKNFWLSVLKTLNEDNTYVDKSKSSKYLVNDLSANPSVFWEYFENECNIFINPNITDDNDEFNKIYRESIIGFGYFNTTIEEQINQIPEFNNITVTNIYDYTKYTNIKERVIGVNNSTGYLVGPKNSPDTIEYIFKYEKARLDKGKEIMENIKNKYNLKYNKEVSLYELKTYCPILQNYKLLDTVLNKGGIDGNDIFILQD